jgi:hypothetical protein
MDNNLYLALLRKAAVVAGINHHHIDESGVWWATSHMSESVQCWNPLRDRDVAGTFARDHGITVRFDESQGAAFASAVTGIVYMASAAEFGGRPAAECRAIVLAAVGSNP